MHFWKAFYLKSLCNESYFYVYLHLMRRFDSVVSNGQIYSVVSSNMYADLTLIIEEGGCLWSCYSPVGAQTCTLKTIKKEDQQLQEKKKRKIFLNWRRRVARWESSLGHPHPPLALINYCCHCKREFRLPSWLGPYLYHIGWCWCKVGAGGWGLLIWQ